MGIPHSLRRAQLDFFQGLCSIDQKECFRFRPDWRRAHCQARPATKRRWAVTVSSICRAPCFLLMMRSTLLQSHCTNFPQNREFTRRERTRVRDRLEHGLGFRKKTTKKRTETQQIVKTPNLGETTLKHVRLKDERK